MKLSQISEMFSTLDMSNIKKEENRGVITYSSTMSGLKYTVLCDPEPSSEYLLNDLRSLMNEQIWNINLLADESTERTGKGNFAEVYRMMLSSIDDLLKTKKVSLITFMGFDKGMDSLYDRFISKFLKGDDPKRHFIYIGHEIWISKAAINSVTDPKEQKILQMLIQKEQITMIPRRNRESL